jgi:hypothetical protein
VRIVTFIFREGSSIVFALFLLAFAFSGRLVETFPPNYVGMFLVALVCLIYLGLQMAMASFTVVGEDKPLFDLFVSLIPGIALVVVGVLLAVGMVKLPLFHILGLTVAAVTVILDVIFNTQVVFKMNRLATDIVQMK